MKPRILAKLDILAAAREARVQESLRRQTAILAQGEAQREILSAYRGRLAESWQGGTVLPAAQARRASQFAAGAAAAAAQIEAAGAAAAAQMQQDADALAQINAHRRNLAERLRAAMRAEAEAAERMAERARPWRRP